MKVLLSHGLRYGGTRPSRHADDANHSKICRRVGSKEVCCRPRFRERIAGNALNEISGCLFYSRRIGRRDN